MSAAISAQNGSHSAVKVYTVANPTCAIVPTPPPILHTQLFINGRFTPSLSHKTFDVLNPTTGLHLATVSEADAADVDAAVTAAPRRLHLHLVQDQRLLSRQTHQPSGRPHRAARPRAGRTRLPRQRQNLRHRPLHRHRRLHRLPPLLRRLGH